jgi:hypothetical protein
VNSSYRYKTFNLKTVSNPQTATDQGIKFISAMAHVKIGTITSYKSALDTYKTLIGIKTLKDEKDIANAGQAEKMPMAMIGLAMLLEKLYR